MSKKRAIKLFIGAIIVMVCLSMTVAEVIVFSIVILGGFKTYLIFEEADNTNPKAPKT